MVDKKKAEPVVDDTVHAQPIPASGLPPGFVETYHPRKGKLMVRVPEAPLKED